MEYIAKRSANFRFIGWFFLCNSILFLVFGSSYLQVITQSTTLFKNLVFDSSSLLGKAYIIMFLVTAFYSYMLLLAFLPACIVICFASFCQTRFFIFVLCVLMGFVSLVLVFADTKVFAMYKFHLSPVLIKMLFNSSLQDLLNLSKHEVFLICLILSGLLFLECCIAWAVWRLVILPKRFKCGGVVAVSWLGAALFSYFSLMLSISIQNNNLLIQQAANFPYYNNLLALVIPKKNAKDALNRFSEGHYMQSQFANDKLIYPKHKMLCDMQQEAKHYNIVLIMVDSLRLDSLQHMPSTKSFADRSWQFMQNYSGGNSTQAGLFSIFYSIPSSYWTAALKQEVAPVFIDLLLENNYNTRVIWASEMFNPPMHKTIYNKLPNLRLDAVNLQNVSDWDRHVTQEALIYLTHNQSQKQPFFLNLFYNAPHAYCRASDFPVKYKPVVESCSRINLTNSVDPTPYYNSYLNAVAFIDDEIGKLLKTIKDNGYLENTVVIITSDHGQEFNENHQNYWEHASNYSKYQVQVPLIIHWPHSNPKKISRQTSNYDLMPTLLTRVFNCKNNTADYSIGRDLLAVDKEHPFLLVGSYVNNCIIEKDRLTTLHLSGEVSITDLQLNTIPNSEPRTEVLTQALKMMREYFQAPS